MKHEERKRQIMEVGLDLFARRGYYNTSVADIIREIGIARGTFYRYFIDKQDLFNYIISQNISTGMAVLPHLPIDRLLPSEEIERRIIRGFQDFLDLPTSRNFVKLVMETMGSERSLLEMVLGFKDFFIKGLSNYFSIAQQKGLFRDRDPEMLSFFLLALLKETFFQWAIYNDFRDLNKLVHELISLIVHGLPDLSERKAP